MVVDGVPPDAHWRFFDEMPWYAIPVANLCSDVNVEAWGAITVVFLLLKFFAVSAITNATVAALIVTVATLTALVWFHVFVLVGARSHRALYAQVPFSKFLQTFWVGAIVCPVGVYLVRAAVGAAIALVPGVSTIASPADVVSGSANQRSEASASDPSAEPTRSRRGGTSSPSPSSSPTSPRDSPRRRPSISASRDITPLTNSNATPRTEGSRRPSRRAGCSNPAAGWLTPRRDPRAVVYLAFVVGLGFSFTENIQYGANVYAVATAWGDAGNVTTRQNVTIDAVLDPFTDYGDAEATPAAELAIRARGANVGHGVGGALAPGARVSRHLENRRGKDGEAIRSGGCGEGGEIASGASLSPPTIRGVGEDARVGESAMVRGRRVHIYRSEAAIEEAARNEAIAVEGPESVEMNVTFRRRPYGESAKRAAAAW